MADLIALHSYPHRRFLASSSMLPRPNNQHGSGSSGNRSLSPPVAIPKARSTNDLLQTATDQPRVSNSELSGVAETDFNTLKDPRLANNAGSLSTSPSTPHHPDLSNEVAALSIKLVQAINNQTTLDDTLAATRQELEQTQKRLRDLEEENDKYRKEIADGILIKKSEMDREVSRLKADCAEEQARRIVAEKGKKGIEQELETLTAALFEEANRMVAAAKHEREAVEKKNEQLRSQIKDTELLLASHQEQLSELKLVMHGLDLGKDDTDCCTTNSTAPSSPAVAQSLSNFGKIAGVDGVINHSEEIQPGPSTNFPHLFKIIYRADIQAYDEFRELLSHSKSSKPPSRVTSGSYSGLNVMGLAALAGGNGNTSSSGSPGKPIHSHSSTGSSSSPQSSSSHIPLKEMRFYKRVLVEDIEPTLRLDNAPGISWLTRRSLLNGICDGTLIVEPMPPSSKKFNFACSICGECRTGAMYERTHRFKTSDSETAQRYPLCCLCLEKLRSCCDFTGYLRLVLDGHVRAGDSDEKDIWEETIRLRERMFWSRLCGGVIPLPSHGHTSRKSPTPGPHSDDEVTSEGNNRTETPRPQSELGPESDAKEYHTASTDKAQNKEAEMPQSVEQTGRDPIPTTGSGNSC